MTGGPWSLRFDEASSAISTVCLTYLLMKADANAALKMSTTARDFRRVRRRQRQNTCTE